MNIVQSSAAECESCFGVMILVHLKWRVRIKLYLSLPTELLLSDLGLVQEIFGDQYYTSENGKEELDIMYDQL